MQGHTDIPLNATGLAQADTAATKLAGLPITRIITSPLARALKTAAVTAEAMNLPLHIDSTLKERTFGSYEGSLRTDIILKHNLTPQQSYDHVLPEDAEQWPATISRAKSSIARWLEAYPDDTLLFVGHGAFLRALHESLTSQYFEAANATPYHYTPTPTGWNMQEI